jgi:hypothetical protein
MKRSKHQEKRNKEYWENQEREREQVKEIVVTLF